MNEQSEQISAALLPRERRTVGVVALIAICRMFGLFALLPVLAIYAARLDHATPTLIGIAVGGYGLTQAALQVPFGALSDRVGRVPVIVAGLLLFAAGSIIAAQSHTIYGVIAGRLLQGGGAISATLSALLADATREEMRTRAMAILGMGIGSSFLLALVLGPVIAAASGVRALFWIAAALAVLAGLLLCLLPGKDAGSPSVRRNRTSIRGIRPAFRADLLRLDLYIFVLHALLTAIFVALPLLLQNKLLLPLGGHWKIYVGALLASLLGTIPLILADERKGKQLTVSVAIFLLLAGLTGLALFASSSMLVLAGLAVFFAGFNFLEAGLPARLSIQAGQNIRGAALGFFSSAQFLGAFAGGLMGGYFIAGGNPGAVFLAGATLCALWLALHSLLPQGRGIP